MMLWPFTSQEEGGVTETVFSGAHTLSFTANGGSVSVTRQHGLMLEWLRRAEGDPLRGKPRLTDAEKDLIVRQCAQFEARVPTPPTLKHGGMDHESLTRALRVQNIAPPEVP